MRYTILGSEKEDAPRASDQKDEHHSPTITLSEHHPSEIPSMTKTLPTTDLIGTELSPRHHKSPPEGI